jgi:hypothetical protein
MSDTSHPTPSSAFSAPPREKFYIRDITTQDAENAKVLENIKGLIA